MNVNRFIASRLRFEGKIVTVSIAVSFVVMIIAVSVSSGFRREIRRGLADVAGDVRLTTASMDFLSENDPVPGNLSWLPSLDSVKGVRSVTPVIYRAGIIKNGDRIHGVLFKGVPTDDSLSLQVSIPSRLSEILGSAPGDKLLTYFVGEKVKARKFTVREIYHSGLEMDDALIVYASYEDMRRLNGWEEGEMSAMEICLDDRFETPSYIEDKSGEIGTLALLSSSEGEPAIVASSVVERFPQLFDWLNLIDVNVLLILSLMTIVAGFNMISGLLILLFRNISTIGILKAMGMTDKGISSVFLRVSSSLVVKGMAIGNVVALLLCLLQSWTHLLKLDPENYFVSFVPMHVNIPMIILADVISYFAIMALLQLPCRFISKVDPARTVRSA